MNLLTLFEVYILWLISNYTYMDKKQLFSITAMFSTLGAYLGVNTLFVHSMRIHLFMDMMIMISIVVMLTMSFKISRLSFQNAMLLAGLCLLGPVFLQDLMYRDIVPIMLTYQSDNVLISSLLAHVDLFQFSLFTLITAVSVWLIKSLRLDTYVFDNRIGNTLFAIVILFLLTIKLPADYLKFGDKLTYLEILVSTVVVFVLIFLSYKILKKYDDDLRHAQTMQKQQDIAQANQRYVYEMEHSYRDIRKLQHDYENNLLVLAELIRNNDISDAKQYLSDIRAATDMTNEKMRPHLIQLHHIENNDVKNVLLVKLLHLADNIQLRIEIPEDITIRTVNSTTITRCMGIILDNALEELDNISGGMLTIAIIEKENNLIFEISNSCSKNTPPVHELMRMAYSTKGSHRGYGLSNLQDIIENSPNMFLDTTIVQQVFTQTLIVVTDTGEHHETNFDM